MINIKKKKAQAELIVTILIILLVLASVVIVWVVVQNTITHGAEQIPGMAACLSTKVDVVKSFSTVAGGNITLKRSVGEGDLAGVAVVVDGVKIANIDFKTNPLQNLQELEQKTYTVPELTGFAGKTVKIAKLIGKDITQVKICDFSDNSAGDGTYIIGA